MGLGMRMRVGGGLSPPMELRSICKWSGSDGPYLGAQSKFCLAH